MAEEEKTEEQASSEPDPQSAEAQTQEQDSEEKVDWEARHRELEAEHTRVTQKAKENDQLIELMTPHTDWNKVQGGVSPETTEADEGDGEPQFISKKEHDEAIGRVQHGTDMKLLTMQFRADHPELRDYEDTLIGPYIKREHALNPALKASQLIANATKFAEDFLETERKKGEGAKADQDKAKAAEVAKASGFSSAGTTAPKKPESQGGESTEEYMARRKEQSRKARGLPG